MKKMYIICLFFISFLSAGVTYWYASTHLGKNLMQQELNNNPYLDFPLDSLSEIEPFGVSKEDEIRINNLTTITMQKFYKGNNQMIEEVINTPANFLEMNREQMITYLEEYMEHPTGEDQQYELYAFELVTFTQKEVVLRKSYRKNSMVEEYQAVNEHGYIVIYKSGSDEIYDYSNIKTENLPVEIQNELKNGIYFQTIQEVYEFLQTYSS